MIEHKENCLITNGKQSVKLESGSISFKNYFKKLPVPFKIYADFECILKEVKSSDGSYTDMQKCSYKNGSFPEKYRDHMPCSFAYKVVCVDNKFSKKVVLYSEKKFVYRFIKAILEEYDYCKKNDKETF